MSEIINKSDRYGVREAMRLLRSSSANGGVDDIAAAVRQVVADKYINRLNEMIRRGREAAMENPSREVTLLAALRPFMREESRCRVDGAIDGLTAFELLWSARESVASVPTQPMEYTIETAETADRNSIHDDGVYDMDNACLLERGAISGQTSPIGMLMLMAMMGKVF